MKRVPRTIMIVTIWVLTGVALAFFERTLRDTFWILVELIWIVYIFVGSAIVMGVCAMMWRVRNGVWGIPAILILVAGLVVSYPHLVAIGDEYQFLWRLDRHQTQYLTIIAKADEATFPPGYQNHQGVAFVVDVGPPLRVAFPQPGGLLDNWEGAVWDPTGSVASATGWLNGVPGEFTAPPEVKALFGGDLLACRHVKGDFYRCRFT